MWGVTESAVLASAAVCCSVCTPAWDTAHLHGDRLSDRAREKGCNGKLPVCCKPLQKGGIYNTLWFHNGTCARLGIYIFDGSCTNTMMCVFVSHSVVCVWTAEVLMLCAGYAQLVCRACWVWWWKDTKAASAANYTFWLSPSMFFVGFSPRCLLGTRW